MVVDVVWWWMGCGGGGSECDSRIDSMVMLW